MRIARMSVLVFTFGMGICGAAWGDLYHVIDLGALPAWTDESTAMDISNTGYVVGITGSGTNGRGFRLHLSEAPMQPPHLLDPLPADTNSGAYSVNNAGHAVGYSEKPPVSGLERAARWEPGSSTATYIGGNMSGARGINDRGEIVGYNNAANGQAVYWAPGEGLESLPANPGAIAFAINEANVNGHGQIVGCNDPSGPVRQAVRWQYDGDWQMQVLPDLPGGAEDGEAYDINDLGTIVGSGRTGAARRATLWDAYGVHDLGDFAGGVDDSFAMGINNLGQVVGYSYTASGERAFLWDSLHGMLNVNDLLDPNDPNNAGWTLLYAAEINDHGWIVGYGTNPSGQAHAFALTPEPGTLALLMLSALPLLRRRRFRR